MTPMTPMTPTTPMPRTAPGPIDAAAMPRPAIFPGYPPLQAPRAVVMVRPHQFTVNLSDCSDNAFLSRPSVGAGDLSRAAFDEVTAMAEAIEGHGVRVHLFDDRGAATPDSVFPNNWFSTHPDGTIVRYPMRARSRRAERRTDIIDELARVYAVTTLRDYTRAERMGRYLEGTGVLVLDHIGRTAYVCRSLRASRSVLRRFCEDMGYRAVVFDAVDPTGRPIYHTNVMLSVGTRIAVACVESIPEAEERRLLLQELDASGRRVVSITREQVGHFAGNCLELSGRGGGVLVISRRGWKSLVPQQRRALEAHVGILPVDVPTIEHSGGSARCMLAGVHLPERCT